MITLLWPDGARVSAPSWQALEDDVRARQWRPYSRSAFRREMRRRAIVWASHVGKPAVLIPTDSAEAMFRAMEALDMMRIETGGDGDADDDDDPDGERDRR